MVLCEICKKDYQRLDNHIKIHGLTKIEYLKIYPQTNSFIDADILIKLSHTGWNKGLTKETDIRVENNGKNIQKTLNERHPFIGRKVKPFSDEHKQKIADALEGHTFTLERKNNISISVKQAWKDGKFKTIFSPSLTHESIIHLALKMWVGLSYSRLGYNILIEKFVTINRRVYAIDVVAESPTERIAIEIGRCEKQKLVDLNVLFDKVIHLIYSRTTISSLISINEGKRDV